MVYDTTLPHRGCPPQNPRDDRPKAALGFPFIAVMLKSLATPSEPRTFPGPWAAEEHHACFIVRDRNYQTLAYIYFEDEPGRQSAAKLLTRAEARRLADAIAKLPELLGC